MIIVPPQLQGKQVDIVPIQHPATGEPADFVINGGLWQVVKLGGSDEFKSVFLESDTQIHVEDPNFQVMIPVNPLFILLPTLRTLSAALPLDALLTIASGDYLEIPPELARKALAPVCDGVGDDMPVLVPAKLDKYLLELVERVPVPKSLQVAEIDDEYQPLYQKFVGFNFVSTWLDAPARAHLEDLLELKPLEEHAASVAKQRDEANTVFMLNNTAPLKRPAKPATGTAAKKPLNNRSLLDMFKKKSK